MYDPVLDKPIRGARNIAAAVNLYTEAGEPDERAAFHALEQGHLDASKRGKHWESTLRRLLAPHLAHIA
jgi:hypothetical protein